MDCKEQAPKIYEFCVSSAKARRTVYYRQVLSALGYGPGVRDYAIRRGLYLRWIACANQNLAPLTAIVTQKATELPAKGFPTDRWEQIKQEVFDRQNWPDVREIDWAYAWANHQELSHKYNIPSPWAKQ